MTPTKVPGRTRVIVGYVRRACALCVLGTGAAFGCSGAASHAAPMTEAAEARDWLGGELGEPPKGLSEKLKKMLFKGFQEGSWSLDDLPGDEAVDVKEQEELWSAILTDSAQYDNTVKLGAADKVRFMQWFRGNFDLKEEALDVDGTSSSISDKEQKDLDAQGMSEPRVMRHLDLGMLLGRVGSKEGIKNGRYRGIPNQMDDAKLAFKQRHSTIRDVLSECRSTHSLARLERFVTTLASDMVESGDPEIERQAARVLQWYQAIVRNLMGRGPAIISYVEEYLDFYRGRGLPVIYDAVIGQRAMFGDGVPGTMFAQNDSSKSVASTVSGSMSSLSSLGPSDSVSQAGNGRAVTDLVEAQGMQMKELMEALKSVRDTVGDLNRRVAHLCLAIKGTTPR